MLKLLQVLYFIFALTSISRAGPACNGVHDINSGIRCWGELHIESYDTCIRLEGNSDEADALCRDAANQIATNNFKNMQKSINVDDIIILFFNNAHYIS